MHVADALVSTPVAVVAATAAAALIAVAGSKIKKSDREDIIPLMGVMGAFIFAAQMINFAIPGTGSSGHIIGGVLLASVLGPWSAFLTLCSVLIIQCLVFADGGLLALGCNIINMGAMTTLIAYPLIMKPLLKFPATPSRILWVSCLACVVGLELGALCVTAEVSLSGVSALSSEKFLTLMTSIHLLIGIGEGLATGTVLIFIEKTRPDILYTENRKAEKISLKRPVIVFAILAVILAGGLSFFASNNPDGLEWAIEKMSGGNDIETVSVGSVANAASTVQNATAIMPDYNNTFSGIVGSIIVLVLIWAISSFLLRRKTGNNE